MDESGFHVKFETCFSCVAVSVKMSCARLKGLLFLEKQLNMFLCQI